MDQTTVKLLTLLACGLFSCGRARAGFVPDLDPMVERMSARFVAIDPVSPDDQNAFFDAPIPKMVHQIWYGPHPLTCHNRVALWQQYALSFGYTYHLWTEEDDQQLQWWMPQENYRLLLDLRKSHNYHAASDLLRFTLMNRLGGVYCDVDMTPPSQKGELINLAQVVPMRGMVLLTENFARNVGNSAMYFANGLMMAAPNHPVFAHLEATVVDNLFSVYPSMRGDTMQLGLADPVHTTGPAFLSRSLAGPFTVLPITYARKLNMIHDGKWDAESGVPFTFDEIGGLEAWQCKP